MKLYLGITGKNLDKITVRLKWKTAEHLGACEGALRYWVEEYGKKALEITAERIHEFNTSPRGVATWSREKLRWIGFDPLSWVEELSGEEVDFDDLSH